MEDAAALSRRSGRAMSSEHAIEQVPLSDIREGDMLQDPGSGKWIKITSTSDGPTGATHSTPTKPYRVYYGDGGEEIDSRIITGLVNRQVRE
jgi:hypothetical protein